MLLLKIALQFWVKKKRDTRPLPCRCLLQHLYGPLLLLFRLFLRLGVQQEVQEVQEQQGVQEQVQAQAQTPALRLSVSRIACAKRAALGRPALAMPRPSSSLRRSSQHSVEVRGIVL